MRKFLFRISLFLGVIGLVTLPATAARAAANIMFILDVSGSMAAKLDGKRKIDLAKNAFNGMITGLPPDTHAGLYVYGHHGNRDCKAFEMLMPPAKIDKAAMQKHVAGLKARRGATPLTFALAKSIEAIGNHKNPGQKTVVLLSDGKENCGGDPVDLATKMGKSLGKLISIYVIGFDVGKDERTQLEAVAKAGNGAYYDAANAGQLASALKTVANKVVKTAIFRDDFDQPFLNESWEVIRDDASNRGLAGGKFALVTLPGSLSAGTAKNVLLYKDAIKERNYEVTAEIAADYQEYGENSIRVNATAGGIVLHQSKDNFIALYLVNQAGGYRSSTGPFAYLVKRQNGKTAKPLSLQLGKNGPLGVTKATLRIEKRAFKYTGLVSLDGKKWKKIGTFALLGKTLKPGLFASADKNAVEAVIEVDSFEIQKVTK